MNSPIMNIPTCSQNNSILGIQANNLPTSIINNTYLPSTSQADATKDLCYEHKEQEELDKVSLVFLSSELSITENKQVMLLNDL